MRYLLLLCLLPTLLAAQVTDSRFVQGEGEYFSQYIDAKGKAILKNVLSYELMGNGAAIVKLETTPAGEITYTYVYGDAQYDEYGEPISDDSGLVYDSIRIPNEKYVRYALIYPNGKVDSKRYHRLAPGHFNQVIATNMVNDRPSCQLLSEKLKPVIATRYLDMRRLAGGYVVQQGQALGLLDLYGKPASAIQYRRLSDWDPNAIPMEDEFGDWTYNEGYGEDGDGNDVYNNSDLPYTLLLDYLDLKGEQECLIATDTLGNKGVLWAQDFSQALPLQYSSFANSSRMPGYVEAKTMDQKLVLFKGSALDQPIAVPFERIVEPLYSENDTLLLVESQGSQNLVRTSDPATLLLDQWAQRIEASKQHPYLEMKLQDRWGIFDYKSKRWLVQNEWDYIHTYENENQLIARLENRDEQYNSTKAAVYDLKAQKMILSGYRSIAAWPDVAPYTSIVDMEGRMGLISESFKMVLPCAYSRLLALGEDTILYRQGATVGMLQLSRMGSGTALPGIGQQFPQKWRTKVGLTTYRHNIVYREGKIAIATNGADYGQPDGGDPLDGLYLLNARNGQIERQIRLPDTTEGETDLNGLAWAGDRLYVGSDCYRLYCFSTSGQELWHYDTPGQVEGCPALTDLNGDKTPDVVAVMEDVGVMALDGISGQVLWKHTSGYAGPGLMNSPALYDLNQDGIDDIIMGGAKHIERNYDSTWVLEDDNERPRIWAIDGKTGEPLWQIITPSRLCSSILVAEQNGQPTIYSAERDGHLRILDRYGRIQRMIKTPEGIYSSPVLNSSLNHVFLGVSGYEYSLPSLLNSATTGPIAGVNSLGLPYQQLTATGTPAGKVSASATVADVLGRWNYQVLMPTEFGVLHVWDELGNPIFQLALPAGAEASATVADVDGDGLLELLIADYDGYLTCYDTQGSATRVHWGQFRGNAANTGVMRSSR